jgi:hypothetical protein
MRYAHDAMFNVRCQLIVSCYNRCCYCIIHCTQQQHWQRHGSVHLHVLRQQGAEGVRPLDAEHPQV